MFNYLTFVSASALRTCEKKLFYLLHSMRHSVTGLNSRWWLAACDWLI